MLVIQYDISSPLISCGFIAGNIPGHSPGESGRPYYLFDSSTAIHP